MCYVKIKKFQELLRKQKYDYAVLINTTLKDPNIFYITGVDIEHSILIIPKTKKPVYLVSSLEFEDVKKTCNIAVKKYRKPLLEIKKRVRGKVGINEKYMTMGMFKEMKKWKKCALKPLDDVCRTARMIKTKKEIEYIQKAAAITDKIFKDLTKKMRNCQTEKDIAKYIEKTAEKYGTTMSFNPIVASGKHAAIPHYSPKETRLQKGFCVIDFGVKYKGYISDMTRTIYFGTPTQKDRQQYEKVLQANKAAIAAVKLGVKCKKIDYIARKHTTYPHGTGHGIGVEVHEAPNITMKSKDVLQENMCFTIEPGKYKKGTHGIRIEDDILVTKKGPVVLTKTTKELLCFTTPRKTSTRFIYEN